MNWFKSKWFTPKPSKVLVAVTFEDNTQTELRVAYTGYFNPTKFAEQMFTDFPYIKKIKVLDFV